MFQGPCSTTAHFSGRKPSPAQDPLQLFPSQTWNASVEQKLLYGEGYV